MSPGLIETGLWRPLDEHLTLRIADDAACPEELLLHGDVDNETRPHRRLKSVRFFFTYLPFNGRRTNRRMKKAVPVSVGLPLTVTAYNSLRGWC